MQFGEQSTSFSEADRCYAEFRRQRDTGTISDGEFNARLQDLMVQDQDGQWWTKESETGRWMYHNGTDWIPGNPPGYAGNIQRGPDTGGFGRGRAQVGGVGTGVMTGGSATGGRSTGASSPRVPAGLWVGMGLACAYLALILIIVYLVYLLPGILGIVFGVLAMRAGSTTGGKVTIGANVAAVFLGIASDIIAVL